MPFSFDDEQESASSGFVFDDEKVAPVAPAKPDRSWIDSVSEFGLDLGKRAAGALVGGVAAIPLGIEKGTKAAVRGAVTGGAETVMPGSMFMPGVDSDESVFGPESERDKNARSIAGERAASAVPSIPFSQATSDLGGKAREAIHGTASPETQEAVANSQISGNLFKGEIDFGKDPSVRGFLMQASDVFGSMLPVIATALVTKNPNAGAVVGGSMAAGEGANSAKDFITKKTDAELKAQSPFFAKMLEAGASPAEARQLTLDKASESAAALQGLVASFGDKFTGKLVTGQLDGLIAKTAGKSAVGKVLAGGALSGGEEGVQELTEGVASDVGIASAVPSKEIGEDSAANFILGAMGGGPAGSARGAYSAWRESADKAAANPVPPAAPPVAPPAAGTPDPVATANQAPEVTAAEKALLTPVGLTALDRVNDLEKQGNGLAQRLDELNNPANGYGPMFDQERQEIEAQSLALSAERADLSKDWPKSVPGLASSFSTEAGARVEAQYALMDAGDLITSHDESLRKNPLYPQELQPRERDRAASEMQVSSIVQKLDPARLGLSADAANGAPIVGADGLVESGNARTIALKRVYQASGQKAADYKTFLRDNAAQFGIAAEAVDGMAKPVLVRVRSTPVNRAEFARQANASTVAAMAPSEQAKSDANRIDSMEDLTPDDNGDFSNAASRPFVQRFMARLPMTEQSGMVDASGSLSTTGYARVRNAVLAKAYGDSPVLARMTESMDDNLRNVSRAFLLAAPKVASMRAAVKDGNRFDADITPDLMLAAEELSKIKGEGGSVQDALAQVDMMGEQRTPEAAQLLQFLNDNMRRPRRMADFISAYMDALDAAGDPNQGSLLGDIHAPGKQDLLKAAERAMQNETQDNGTAPAGIAAPDSRQAGQKPGTAQGGGGGAQGNGVDAGNAAQGSQDPRAPSTDWVDFHPDTGAMGVPRAKMPQVKANKRAELYKFLQAKGIDHTRAFAKAKTLKPTQAEYSPSKAENAQGLEGTKAVVLVSSDNYILDGHHRWVARAVNNEPVDVIRFNAPIGKLLEAVREFPDATTSNESTDAAQAAPAATMSREQHVTNFNSALGDLAQIASQHTRLTMIQEDAPQLMPVLVKLFDAAIGIVGTDIKKAIAHVKAAMKAHPDLKTFWNKIKPETYQKAAMQALENPPQAAQNDMFAAPVEPKEKASQPDTPSEQQTSEVDAPVDDAKPVTTERDSFTLERLNRETDKMEPVTFARGEYVQYTVGGNELFGDIDGISQARKEFSVDGLWYPFGFAYKADRPAEVKPPTVPLSSVLDAVNKKYGQGLTDADAVPQPVDILDAETALWRRITDGTATVDEFKAGFARWVDGKDEIIALLSKNTKDQLFKLRGSPMYDRYKSEPKAEVVDSMWRDGVTRYVLARSFSHGMGKNAWLDGVRNMVEATDSEQLAQYAKDRKNDQEEALARVAKTAEGIKDPQTLGDFHNLIRATKGTGKTFKEARLMLTPAQRAQFDDLTATASRAERATSKEAKQDAILRAPGEAVTATDIINTKHTKHGHDLWQFNLEQRVSGDEFKSLVTQAKRLGGDYSSYRGNGAIPGWQFRTEDAAKAFKALIAGDTTAAKDVIQERRDAFADDRGQSATERLNEMADRLDEHADASLNQERKQNTDKRARQAASAEAAANAEKAMAKTMRNIAQAIASGKAKFLDRVRQKVQVEALLGYVATAHYDELRAKYPSYAEQERHRGEMPTTETADFAEFPMFSANRSDLAMLARQLLEVDGTKLLGQRLLKEADDVTDAYLKFAKENFGKVSAFSARGGGVAAFGTKADAEAAIARSGYKGKAIAYQVKRGEHAVILSPSEAVERGIWQGDGDQRIALSPEFGTEMVEKIGKAARRGAKVSVPWQLETAHDRRKVLDRMGIETPAEFRAALREFIGLREQAEAPNKVKQLERAMVGRSNDGLDFFPTPESVADEMVATAGIDPGMAVLEPSAGWGHIAERIRAAGAEPDVGEMSEDRRELLEAKGFRLVGRDFMAINPREFFTYGDTFKAADGTEGVMRGSGELGSNRVRLVDTGGNGSFHDRDELTGVRKNGTESGYDRIIMNPPFSDGRDIQHVQHAYTLLKPGGRIVAIMGESAFMNQNKRATEFRGWLEQVGGTAEKLAEGSFNDPSLPVNTGANARMVVIDKSVEEQGVATLSRGQGGGMELANLQALAERIQERMPNMPKVNVFASPLDLPVKDKSLRDYIEKQGAMADVEGAMHKGELYLFASGLSDPLRAEHVLAEHEAAHFGLSAILGDSLKTTMQAIYNNNAAVRQAATELQKRGKLSNSEATEEVIVDIPSSELVKLKGWRKLVVHARDWLQAHGFDAMAAKLGNWLDGSLDDQQRADLFVAGLVRTARAFAAGKRGQRVVPRHDTMLSTLAEDAAKQEQWLANEARSRGYSDIDQLAEQNYPLFEKLAELWRKKHPAEDGVLLSRGESLLKRQFDQTAAEFGGENAYEVAKSAGKTKLTYTQWVQVRTPNFMKWWGFDWTKGTEHEQNTQILGGQEDGSTGGGNKGSQASGIVRGRENSVGISEIHPSIAKGLPFVDAETGEPLVFFHGTRDAFTAFDVDHPNKKDAGWLGRGHYVSSDRWIAETYSRLKSGGGDPRVMSLFVRPSDPYLMLPKDKARVSRLSAEQLARFTGRMKEAGYRSSMVAFDDGLLELAVFDANSLKSATDNSGEFGESSDIRMSRSPIAGTTTERANQIIQEQSGTAQPLDAMVKAMTKITGIERATKAIYSRAGFYLDRIIPETIKAGMVADYGVPESVIDQRAMMQGRQRVQLRQVGSLVERLATLTRAESRVAYEWLNESNEDASQELMKGLPEQSIKVLQDVRQMIDRLSKEAVRMGQLTAEAYERNKFAYLRRSYAKYTLDQTESEKKGRARAISILGDQYKGRGLTESASMGQIKGAAPDWWQRKMVKGKADTALKGEMLIRLERHAPAGERTQPLDGMEGKQAGKLREVMYWPQSEPIPAKYSEWTQAGVFEVRDTKGANAILWRDFTKGEREKMGELDEARFAITKTLHGMVHDVEVGRYLEWLGQNHAKKPGESIPGVVVEASERYRDTFKPGEWVEVPDTKIPGTGVAKYGKLAGRYLPGPVWNDLRQTVNGQFRPFGDTYAKILSLWKTSKTALSPAVHMNNIMSNFVMADWHDVTAGHIAKSLRIIMGVHEQDGKGALGTAGNKLAKGLGASDREASQEIMNRYLDSGGNLGSWATNEVATKQIEPLLAAMEQELALTGGASHQAQAGVMSALQHTLMLRLPSAFEALKNSKPGQMVGTEAKSLMELYQSEDEVFRLASWLKAKEEGRSDMEAGKLSRRSFLDYNINAPWVQAMRNSALPFISYTYRAVPKMLDIAGNKPHKLMKLMLVAGALNALGAMLSGGDDDKERKLLPEEKAGKIWGMVPKLIRMPWNDTNASPVYLDIRRFIPVGDVLDVGANHAAIPLLPMMTPGGPLVIAGEVVLNKTGFTGKPITLETDTPAQQARKVMDYLYKAFMPNVVGLPGTYASTGVLNAAKGKTDAFGREQSVAQAMASSFGVKLGSYPADVMRKNETGKAQAMMMEIDKNISQLKRQRQTNSINDAEFQSQVQVEQGKKRKIQEDLAKKLSQ